MRGRRVGESKREENREKGSVEKRTPPVEGGLGGAEKGVGQDCGSKEVKLATRGLRLPREKGQPGPEKRNKGRWRWRVGL